MIIPILLIIIATMAVAIYDLYTEVQAYHREFVERARGEQE